jgi:hypothetical protein
MAGNPWDSDPIVSAAGGNPWDSDPIVGADNSPPETAGRVAGLGARAVMQGVGQLADLPGNLVAGTDWIGAKIGTAARRALGLPSADLPGLSYGSPVTNAATNAADTYGLPTPATPGERIASAAVAAAPSAILAPEAPIAGALWGAAGGAASQTTAEAGGGPVAQTLAGLAAGGLPVLGAGAAGLARTATRGAGADAAAATADRIAAAQAAGVDLNAGQATGSRPLQWLTSTGGRMWGGGPVEAQAAQQAEALKSHVDRITDNLSGGVTPSPTTAGEAINTGVAAAKQSMRQAEKSAYDARDALVPDDHPTDVSGTQAALDQFSTPTPGATNTTGALVSPKIAALSDNLASDVQANGGTLPYSAARQVHTALGNNIDWGFAPADPVANGALKQVYGALGNDLNTAATAISPEAAQAAKGASALYAANSAKRELLNTIVDKSGGPEAVYQAATNGTKLGATKIDGVMNALDPQRQNIVRATVLDRMGRSIPSQQNAASTAFSADTFLTNWAKMAPEAKDALFGASGSGNQLRRSLDSLEGTASAMRGALKGSHNPSGTGGAIGHGLGLGAILTGVTELAMHGEPHTLALAGGVIGGNAILSRVLTNPRTARWLAQTTKLPPSARPNAVMQLAKMAQATNDPDARDAIKYMAGVGTAPQPTEIQHQPDPQAAYNSLPPGAAYTHNGQTLYKGGTVRVQHPDGRTGTIPRSQLSDALVQGYRQR